MSEKEKRDINKLAEESEKKFIDDLDNTSKDTKVMYFLNTDINQTTTFNIETEQGKIYNLKFKIDNFIIKKELKEKILDAISWAMSEAKRPYIILVPQKMISKRNLYKNMSYPLIMFGCKVYFIKGIDKVIVLENE